MKNNKIIYDVPFNNISKDIKNAIFLYEESYNYNELCDNIKKHPFKKTRVLLFLALVFTMCFLYFDISKSNNIDNYTTILLIFLFLFLSLFITVIITIISIKQLSNSSSKKIYFYQTFMIIANNYKIYKISYNKISTIKQNKTSYFIIANSIDIKLEKDKLDNDSKLFLKNLANNYKKIQLNLDSEQNIWNNLIKDDSDAIISCLNEINSNSIKQYYANINVKIDMIFHYYLMHLLESIILIFILLFPLYHYTNSNIKIIYLVLFVPCLVFILELIKAKKNVEINSNEILKYTEKMQLFFYKEFFIIKSPEEIVFFKYNDLKIVLDSEQLLFMKFKLFSTSFLKKTTFYPLIIDKNKFNKKERNFLYKMIKS